MAADSDRVEMRRPRTVDDALSLIERPGARFIAGGTDLITLQDCSTSMLVDLQDLEELSAITVDPSGNTSIGAAVRLADAASNETLIQSHPAITKSILAGASPQLRAMATIGGNLLQRTRCPYFRAPLEWGFACNKRVPGSGCSAIEGHNRTHAIFGTSASCVAAHPSDLAVALVAFDARVHVRGPGRCRSFAVNDLLRLPADRPERDTNIEADELITHVTLPALPAARNAAYIKVRDRASYEFALVSVAAGLDVDDAGTVRDARIAAGGVGTTPWRLSNVEDALCGHPISVDKIRDACNHAADGATPRQHNAFKVELLRRTVRRAISAAWKPS